MDNLKELSERARACSKKEWREKLKDCHANLDKALDALWRTPTAENLREVNNQWSRAERAFTSCPPEADPLPPLSGAPVAALLAA